MQLAFCWAHGRRKLIKAKADSHIVREALLRIAALHKLEDAMPSRLACSCRCLMGLRAGALFSSPIQQLPMDRILRQAVDHPQLGGNRYVAIAISSCLASMALYRVEDAV